MKRHSKAVIHTTSRFVMHALNTHVCARCTYARLHLLDMTLQSRQVLHLLERRAVADPLLADRTDKVEPPTNSNQAYS